MEARPECCLFAPNARLSRERFLNHSREPCLPGASFQRATVMVTLGEAARQLGLSKPTVSKAISKGQLSATRREDGSFAIDPSEIARWWSTVQHRFQPQPVIDLQP